MRSRDGLASRSDPYRNNLGQDWQRLRPRSKSRQGPVSSLTRVPGLYCISARKAHPLPRVRLEFLLTMTRSLGRSSLSTLA